MRKLIGITLFVAAVFYAAYEVRSGKAGTATFMGVIAMAVAGGIMLRRSRNAPFDASNPVYPKLSPLPKFDLSSSDVETVAAYSAPPPSIDAPTTPRIESAQVQQMLPPAPPKVIRTRAAPPPTPRERAKLEAERKSGPGIRLVVSDGLRTDVRDYRKRKAQ